MHRISQAACGDVSTVALHICGAVVLARFVLVPEEPLGRSTKHLIERRCREVVRAVCGAWVWAQAPR